LDIITLDGNLFYITEISHDIDPADNKWWMNISAEWLKPFTGSLGFLAEKKPESGTPVDKGTEETNIGSIEPEIGGGTFV